MERVLSGAPRAGGVPEKCEAGRVVCPSIFDARNGGIRRGVLARAASRGSPARGTSRSAELLEGMFSTGRRGFSHSPLAGGRQAGTRPVIAFAEFG